jgi:hypothetical protein
MPRRKVDHDSIRHIVDHLPSILFLAPSVCFQGCYKLGQGDTEVYHIITSVHSLER